MTLTVAASAFQPESLQERLERALATAAELVALHGDAYAPIFERVEEELHNLRRRSSAADRARQFAARTLPRAAISPALR